jgi:nitroimidazol reductase NimA-like FMN-containing flavoprotein (pyridoxamine 5'-phosphate oxidase superfamily)
MTQYNKSNKSRLNRKPGRGNYDEETVNAIIDEALVCHVGFIQEGMPFVIPSNFARMGDKIILHGAKASRLMKQAASGEMICIEMTLLDGLVLARSAFDHSVNYRSVVIFGRGELLTENADKMEALKAVSEHLVKGRWDEIRQPTEQELDATAVVIIPIEEASAKSRTGGVIDEPEDYVLPIWAGILPLKLQALEPISDDRLVEGVTVPNHVTALLKK